MRKYVSLVIMLAAQLAAHATVQTGIALRGQKQTVNGKTYYAFVIQSMWGGDQIPRREGSSHTFSNTTMAGVTLNGTLNFQESSSGATDVITASSFTVTIENSSLWFYDATVQTMSGTDVTNCSTSVSSNNHTLTVTIPSGKTFGTILIDYVANAPISSSNTVISGVDDEYLYLGDPIEPEPVVTYNGTVLTKDTDYTLSYWGSNRVGEAQITVTGTGEYAGDINKRYTIRKVALSDFNSLGNNTYEIATTTDLDYLALYINTGNDHASGCTFKQTADIAYSYTMAWNATTNHENNFTAVGGHGHSFQGTYDGQNYTISGIRIYKNGTTDYDTSQGLFGYIASGAIVKNVILADACIVGYNNTGGIVGYNSGTIEDCRVESNVYIRTSSNVCSDVGGIAGISDGTNASSVAIRRCTFKGRVSHYESNSTNIGGIVGEIRYSTVSNCLALGANVCGNDYSGAIVGYRYTTSSGTITGTLTANHYHDTKVNNSTTATGVYVNVGVGNGSGSTDQDGARSVHTLTLPDGVTATGESVVIDNVTYYASNTTVTLAYNGTPPNNTRFDHFTVDGDAIVGDTFTMPAADAEIGVEFLARYTFDSTTGVLSLNWGEFNSSSNYKWGSDVIPSAVTSVTATDEVSFTGSCFELFKGFSNCTSMDLSNVNTDALTRTNYMFFSCGSLTTLDLSGWNTASVNDISNMFTCCSSLTTLNLSGWNTASVTNMGGMFSQNTNLTAIEGLSDFDTGNVTVMTGMFEYCSSLTTLDLSGWNTTSFTNMLDMFDGCSSLTSLDLSGWNTGNVTDMSTMFCGCSNLTTIYVGAGWGTANVTNSDFMFSSSTNLVGGMGTAYNADHVDGDYARIDMGPNSNQPGYLTGVFALTLADDITASPAATLVHGEVNLYKSGSEVTLTYGGDVPEDYGPVYSVNGAAIEGNTFTMPFEDASVTVEVQRLRYIFDSETGELALIWGEFNKDDKWGTDVTPSAVTSVTATDEVSFTGDCTELFMNFTNCTSMDLSKVNTDEMTIAWNMFVGCSSLASLDLLGWNTGNVTHMTNMFASCSSLTTIEGLSDFNTSNVTNMSNIFASCSSLESLDLTGWNTGNVTNMNYMFGGCSSLQSLNLSGWDVSKATDLGVLFNGCQSLTTLDVSNWTIGSANFNNLFLGCTGTTTLDLSTWNTSGVTNMLSMFLNCSNLKTIYVSEGWSTENVTVSNAMFVGCTSLVGGMGTTYDANHTDGEYARMDRGDGEPGYLTGVFTLTLPEDVTSTTAATLTHNGVNYYKGGHDVTLAYNGMPSEGYRFNHFTVGGEPIDGDTFAMPFANAEIGVEFQGRYSFNSTTGELSLNWGAFNKDEYYWNDVTASAVTSVTATDEVSFTGDCSNLFLNFINCTSMDLSNANTDALTNTYSMFGNCTNLTSLDLTNWNVSNVSTMSYMFLNCTSLETLDLSGWNTSAVSYMGYMFTSCSSLASLDISGWNTASVTDMSHLFDGCENLASLDLSGWNTASVTNMESMFQETGIETLDLSGWNTGNVTNMDGLFSYSVNLTTIYVGEGWTTENVTNTGGLFYGSCLLVGGMGTKFNPDHIVVDYACYDRGDTEPGYLTGVFALTLPENVTASPTATLTHGEVNLYMRGHDVTLSYGGEVHEGYAPLYSVNGTAIEGDTFTMPFEDATVTQHLVTILSESETVPANLSGIVAFRREFTGGKASTICLPFDYEKGSEGIYYTFGGVTYNSTEGKWEATMNEISGITLAANTPYLFVPAGTEDVSVLFHGTAGYDVSGGLATTDGDWTFHGTYSMLTYGTAPMTGHIYGFASKSKTVDGQEVEAGDFVHAKEGAGVPPMRCYLTYKNGQQLKRSSVRGVDGTDDEVPDRITVRLVSADGTVTAVGSIETDSGNVTIDTWYDMGGRSIDGTPIAPGLYINNGRKVMIK